MNFDLTDDQLAFADTAKQFAEQELAPYAAKWDSEHIFPKEVIQKAGELGFCSLYSPESEGGMGLSRLDSSIIFEQLAMGCTTTTAMMTIHNMATWMVSTWGTRAAKDKWCPSLVTGQKLASYCLTEPGSGSDAAAMRSTAKKDGKDYLLNGSKMFITSGMRADYYVIACRTGGPGTSGISAIPAMNGIAGVTNCDLASKFGTPSQAGLLLVKLTKVSSSSPAVNT